MQSIQKKLKNLKYSATRIIKYPPVVINHPLPSLHLRYASSKAARLEGNELRNYVAFFNIIIPRSVVEEVIWKVKKLQVTFQKQTF